MRNREPWSWCNATLGVLCILSLSLLCCDSAELNRAVGERCAGHSDCADRLCYKGICVAGSPADNGEPCSQDAQCRSLRCVSGLCAPGNQQGGRSCRHDEECASGLCINNVCKSPAADAGDGGARDLAALDHSAPDTAMPDAILPDAAQLDAAKPDTAKPDAGNPDAAKPDAGPCPGGCMIDFKCYAALAIHPNDSCYRCEPAKNNQGWTAFPGKGCVTTFWKTTGNCGVMHVHALALDEAAGKLYAIVGCTVRQFDLATGKMTTLWIPKGGCQGVLGPFDGTTKASLKSPTSAAWDATSQLLLVVDQAMKRVVKISFKLQQVALVAGTGTGCTTGSSAAASFDALNTLALVGSQDMYVSDSKCGLRRITGSPAVDSAGRIYVAQAYTQSTSHRLRRVDIKGNKVETVAGSKVRGHKDGPALSASFYRMEDLEMDSKGNIYIADDCKIRLYSPP